MVIVYLSLFCLYWRLECWGTSVSVSRLCFVLLCFFKKICDLKTNRIIILKCWHWINANFAPQQLSRMIYPYKVKTFTKIYLAFYIFLIPLLLTALMIHVILMFAHPTLQLPSPYPFPHLINLTLWSNNLMCKNSYLIFINTINSEGFFSVSKL